MSVLNKLRINRIFSITKVGEKFVFEEECDGCFGCTLSKEEFEKLIDELQALTGSEF